MKRCLSCKHVYLSEVIECSLCGFQPPFKDGFSLYSTKYADGGSGFKAAYFTELAKLEAKNFWFKSRNNLIIWALKKYCKNFKTFFEVGCGSGFVLSGISRAFPDAALLGSEIFTAGLNCAAERLPSVKFIQMDAREIPYFEEFDAIGAFDVLEHINEDKDVIGEIYSALKPNGFFVLTVPQHQWLWSTVDEFACHVRRYSRKEIHSRLEERGFKIVRSTSFVTTLLPAMLWSRVFQRKRAVEEIEVTTELSLPAMLNSIFIGFMNFESFLIKVGINLPIGGSRLVIAKKIK